MKKAYRIISFLLVLCLVAGLFTGCGDATYNRAQYEMLSTECVDSGVMAENSKFILEWDNEYKCVLAKSKQSGKVWSTTPHKLYLEGEANATISSPIEINVIDPTSKSIDFGRAYISCVTTGNMSAEKIDNGIRVTYYFDEFGISVPICYIIREDSVAITFDTTKVTEGDSYKLLNVAIAPFLCSSENNVEGNYVFVPSGTGALMNAISNEGDRIAYSSEVYGVDASRLYEEQPIENEKVKMPVFGAKDGDSAIMGIVEQGAEMAVINAATRDKKAGYANVYPNIYTRGYDIYAQAYGHNTKVSWRNSEIMSDQNVVIGYYFLEGEKANYAGMAERYREYLIEKNILKKSSQKENAYAVSVLGNIMNKKLAFGFPYKDLESLTTFSETEKIISGLASSTGLYPTVQMKGFGKTGIDVGEVAGGYKFASLAGSLKDYMQIEDLAKNNNFLLSVDFDLLNFNNSGSGVTTANDVAKSPSKFKVKQRYPDIALRWYSDNFQHYYLVSRSKLSGLVDKLIDKAAKLGVTGISTSSLGQVAYSDYSDAKYATRLQTETDVAEYLTRIKNAGYKVVTDDANVYAAAVSDSVLNLKVDPYNMDGIDQYIPFYQMVFKGYVPLYSEPINLTANYKVSLLNALASGTGLGYTVMENYDITYVTTPHTNIYNSLYSDIKDDIIADVSAYKSYYAAIEGASIVNYRVLDTGVTETVFDNGVVAYTNASDTAKDSPVGQLSAYGFKFSK